MKPEDKLPPWILEAFTQEVDENTAFLIKSLVNAYHTMAQAQWILTHNSEDWPPEALEITLANLEAFLNAHQGLEAVQIYFMENEK